MNLKSVFNVAVFVALGLNAAALEIQFTSPAAPLALVLAAGKNVVPIVVSPNNDKAVRRAAQTLAADFARVTGGWPVVQDHFVAGQTNIILLGTIGQDALIDRLIAEQRLAVSGVRGAWESYVLQIVTNPFPGVARALVIAGSDRRGTIYGSYELSERIGVSPWHWWADVPVLQRSFISVSGDRLVQGSPAVKYRGIFLNDEDFGLRPWAAKTWEPETGNLGSKTYAQIFELLLRLRANYLWPAMHEGTAAFNSFATNRVLADEFGIVLGSSHCEQMLRNNVAEWDTNQFGAYDYVANRAGVLNYWEQRVRENGAYDNIFTVGMRGIHDGGMPGGGSAREKADRLHHIIADQREMLARLVNTNLATVPQIFCPYKEVLALYRLAPEIPADITLVWPDDNYGYIRQFSNAQERQRSGGAGVYYHVSYWGAPRDYLWLCSTPPALIAEEMTKAYDYGADRVWVLNVGDLKPAEWATEFFLRLAWQPHGWQGTNTYALLGQQIARDFGVRSAAEITGIMAEYYRLNFQRKPEHIGFPSADLFTPDEAQARLAAWARLAQRVTGLATNLAPGFQAAFFELVAYPVQAAALANQRSLAPAQAVAARAEIRRLTEVYNTQIAGGKWQHFMSDNPRGMVDFKAPQKMAAASAELARATNPLALSAANFPGADFVAGANGAVLEAEHASQLLPGAAAGWRIISGLGYNGEAVAVSPTTSAVRITPEKIRTESPALQFKIWLEQPGDWQVTLRALPTFSVATGQAQRYAVAFDEAPLQIIAWPNSTSEKDPPWQENVLRNAVLTTSQHHVNTSGLHTLKIWQVDAGIVLDALAVTRIGAPPLGYVWPDETRVVR